MRDKKEELEDRLDFSFFNSYTDNSYGWQKGERGEPGVKKKIAKKGTASQAIKNNLYIMGFAWRICPLRVISNGIYYGLGQFEYLFFSGFFMKKVLSLIENGGSFQGILSFTMLTAGLFGLIFLYNSWYENYLVPVTDVKVYQGLYHTLYQKAGNVDLSCFEDSDFYNRYMMAMADSDKRLAQTIDNVWHILIGTLAVVVSWVMMFRIDRYVVFFIFAPIIGNFVFANALNKLTYRIYEESMVFRRIADYVNRVIHLADYAKELRMTDIFHVMEKKQEDARAGITGTMDKYLVKSVLLGWGYLYFTFVIIFEGVIFYGAYRTMVAKEMPLSDFVVLTTLMSCVSWALIDYTRALLESMKNSLFIQNFREFLDYEPAIPEDAEGIMPDREIHSLEFRNVSFAYKPGRMALKNISFTLKEKEACALVGYNGAGKSTLIKLLLRFYDPTEGEILLNGVNIKEYNLKAYRGLFAAAFQDGKIFARSVRDNLEMGKEKNDDDIQNALLKAGMQSVAEGLPGGMDAVLTREFDPEGVVFSGGQNQKLVAARAFLQDTPVRLFDEPSSALDPIAEHALIENIKKDSAGRILLLISHRLSCVQDMEKIIVLKDGRIAEQGTHGQLMEAGGEYASLYRMQAEQYRMEKAFSDPGRFRQSLTQ